MLRRLVMMAVALAGATTAFGQSSLFKIDLSTRATGKPVDYSDAQYNLYQQNLWNLTSANRKARGAHGLYNSKAPYIAPAIIRFVKNGSIMRTGGQTRGAGITLVIDPTFNNAEAGRVAFMQNVYTNAQTLIEQYFGDAAISGTVNVVNADDTIGDRNAITGGYYLPNNGSGGREIRLPLNGSPTVAAVSLVHCIMLAYLPDPAYAYDGYLEGLVRAATANVVRNGTFQATLGLDSDIVEELLAQTYEIGAHYDWTNQKSLGGPQFIAPNLLSTPVNQGTRGGIFWQRYQMSGSVWEKVLTQYPNFIKNMNLAYRGFVSGSSSPATADQLEAMAGTVIGAGTVEGDTFPTWVRKQFILDTKLTVGTKLHSLITPITAGLDFDHGDFGVFNIEGTLFSTDASGNETLLSGTSYPVFWTTDYQRLLSDSQSSVMDIAASYGSSAPNFPNNNANLPYRVSIDLPVQDRLIRQYVPAGAVATKSGNNTIVSDFYGTVTGIAAPLGTSLLVRVQNGSDTFDAPVSNYAFGLNVGTAIGSSVGLNFNGARSLTVKVIRQEVGGSETTLLTRVVNKGPGPLSVQLGNDPVVDTGFPSGLSSGVQMVGFTGDPLYSDLERIFGTTNFLAARYNPAKTAYDLYPRSGTVMGGQGYFLRVPVGGLPSWKARVESGTAVSIALRPGWNMVTCPLGMDTPFSNVDVVHTTEFPRTYLGASGNDSGDTSAPLLGKDVFQFVPGANDPVTGMPEGGSMVPATTFAAGKGYFVRCLAPEGAVMLFRPAVNQTFAHQSKSSPIRYQHLLEIQVSRPGEASMARIGQAPGATNNFDAKFDSNLPPSFGGLQLGVLNGDLRFQDVKTPAPMVTNKVTASGCVVGQKYSLIFLTKEGRATQIQVKDLQTGKIQYYASPTGTFLFSASKTTMAFEVTVRGARS